MSSSANNPVEAPSYVIYDQKTGRPIARHRQFNLADRQFEAAAEADVLALYGRSVAALARVSEKDPQNLAVLELEKPTESSLRYMQVRQGRLLSANKLIIYSDKDELEGDGQDSAQITIMLQDEAGNVVKEASDPILLTTTRGKLSARGGRLQLNKGRAVVTLTSVPETVNVVRLRVQAESGFRKPAELHLSFA